jgi:predicted phosphodiesterase
MAYPADLYQNAPRSSRVTIRLLAIADLHQRPAHYHRLAALVQKHQPQIIAFVGDFLNSDGNNGRNGLLTEAECAECVARLPAERTIFVRGNHEERNWAHFMDGWPKFKPLECLYGNALVHGPLVIVGFPSPTHRKPAEFYQLGG